MHSKQILEYLAEHSSDVRFGDADSEGLRPLVMPSGGIRLNTVTDFLIGALQLEDGDVVPPSSLSELDGLWLAELSVRDGGEEQRGAFRTKLAWRNVRWGATPGLFESDEVTLKVWFKTDEDEPELKSKVIWSGGLGGVPMEASMALPGSAITGSVLEKTFEAQRFEVGPLLERYHLSTAGFKDLGIGDLEFDADVEKRSIDTRITVKGAWSLEGLTLSSLKFAVHHQPKEVTGSLEGTLTISRGGGASEIHVSAECAGGDDGWVLEGAVEIAEGHPHADLATFVDASTSLPEVLGTLSVSKLAARFHTATRDLSLDLTTNLPGLGDTDVELSLEIKHPASEGDGDSQAAADGKADVVLKGRIELGDAKHPQRFDLIFGTGEGDAPTSTMLGVYANPGGQGASLPDLLRPFVSADESVEDVLQGFKDFKIRSALFAYQGKGRFLCATDMDIGVDLNGLGSLPIVGRALADASSFSLTFQPVFCSSKPENLPDLAAIKKLAPSTAPALPEKLEPSVTLITALRIGDLRKVLNLGDALADAASAQAKVDGDLGTPEDSDGAVDAGGAMDGDHVNWFDLQKALGPLHLQRVGIGYDDGKILVALDAEMLAGPVTLQLAGLGAAYELESKKLSFSLHGMSLDFRRDPIEISGAFMRTPSDDFAGLAKLKMKTFDIGAIGAYGEHKDAATGKSYPSLFIYAFVDKPLGGPGFFFVEGLAAGFGLNRTLTLPPIDKIRTFPLVAEVIGGSSHPEPADEDSDPIEDLRNEFDALERYIEPALGQYWLAVGVKFTTYQQVDSFALVSASFGKHFEIDLMGISQLTVPANSKKTLAFIELAFSARINPDEGLLAVQAALTKSSWILSKHAKLEGGFAFSAWFAGPHAGEFVYTIGGYHPDFKVPAHYPSVKRLGFRWQIDKHTEIKGKAYFALTSSAFMVGGSLKATWHNSWAKAWFHLSADFLIQWKPYHYSASMRVSIGARVTIHFFGTHHLSFHARARVSIWGPEFAGKAKVTVTVLGFDVDFTVRFGGHKSSPTKLKKWSDFEKTFLPEKSKQLVAKPSGGLIRTLAAGAGPGASERWIFDPKRMALAVESAVPFTQHFQVKDPGAEGQQPDGVQDHGPEDETTREEQMEPPLLGVEPMGVRKGEQFKSWLSLSVIREPAGDAAEVSGDFAFHPIRKLVPNALWNPHASPRSKPNPNSADVRAVTGYTIHPIPPSKPSTSNSIRDGNLQYVDSHRLLPREDTRAPEYSIFPGDSRADADATARRAGIAASMGDATKAEKRAAMFELMGFDRQTSLSLRPEAANCFVDAPIRVTAH